MRLFFYSRAIYCLSTFNIWSAVASSAKVFCCIISPIILLFIIMLSICWFNDYIDWAICTASTEFICWFITCAIFPNIATVCSLDFIDLILSHINYILTAVRWKFKAINHNKFLHSFFFCDALIKYNLAPSSLFFFNAYFALFIYWLLYFYEFLAARATCFDWIFISIIVSYKVALGWGLGCGCWFPIRMICKKIIQEVQNDTIYNCI